MKLDTHWPPAPRLNRPALPADDLPPARMRAIARLSHLAEVAELHLVPNEAALPDEAPARGPESFVALALAAHLDFLQSSGVDGLPPAPDLGALRVIVAEAGGQPPAPDAKPKTRPLNGLLFKQWAELPEVEPRVMLIHVPRARGVPGLGPMRGDVAIFADGHCAIITASQCRGCQHFEAVEFTPAAEADQPPTIRERTHWASTLHFLVRLVIEGEAPTATATPDTEGDAAE